MTVARRKWTAIAGIVAGAVALGVSQLAAAPVRPSAAPVVAVGDAVVDITPAPVKNAAIATLGPLDKPALLIGILVLLVLAAAEIGVLTARRRAYGVAGMALFAAIGVAAAVTRPDAGAADALPTLLGAAAGLITLLKLTRLAAPVDAAEDAARDTAHGADRDAERGVAPDAAQGVALDTERGDASDVDLDGESARRSDGGAAEPEPVEDAALDRRRLIKGVAVGVGVAGVAYVGGRFLGSGPDVSAARATLKIPPPARPAAPLPAGTDLNIRGLAPFVTPNKDFYRVDTALILPDVSPRDWKLRIHGLVDRPLELTFADLLKRPLREADVTLACVSNEVGGSYIGNARWLGAYLPDLLREAGIRSGADMLLTTSQDGWTCGTPVDVVMDGREALLAVAMNGVPLPVEHGFPARQVVPGLYGYVSATKWITDIKVTRFAVDQAYWTSRGWSAQGPIKTQSRIDVPRDGANVRAGKVTIAGVAWAQHRGIERVEVRIDDAPWRTAELAAVPGPDTWRQWSLPWDASKGDHRIVVRATDRTGETQTALPAPPEPNGATGWPTIRVTVD